MASPYIATAVKAARRAAQEITAAAQQLDRLAIDNKSENDFVTAADRAAEDAILNVLQSAYPRHAILTEERGLIGNAKSEWMWIVDPIDGTTNFIHGVPQYAVSIALCRRGEPVVAVVYDVAKNELFTAVKGEGAFLDNRRIRVSDNAMQSFMRVTQATAGVRRPGAASLDLAWVAAGRYDGFWESGLSKWDIAAGGLLVFEAGGLLTDLEGGEEWLEKGSVCCGNPKIFGQLLPLVGKLPAPEAKTDEAKEEPAAEGDAK